MEGGSPALIRQRWTIPLYQAQKRYWGDNPRAEDLLWILLGAHFKNLPKRKKTPPPRKEGGPPEEPFDWSLFDRPLTPEELGQIRPGAETIR